MAIVRVDLRLEEQVGKQRLQLIRLVPQGELEQAEHGASVERIVRR